MCHDGQAALFTEEWAREHNRAVHLSNAAMDDDVKAIQKLVDDLSVAVARIKPAKVRPMIVIKFVNYIDPRHFSSALYDAASYRAYRAFRLLHELRADLDARTDHRRTRRSSRSCRSASG